MVEQEAIEIPDFQIREERLTFVTYNPKEKNPISQRGYRISRSNGQSVEGTTAQNGQIDEQDLHGGRGRILLLEQESGQQPQSSQPLDQEEYPENPGPLPVLDLRNQNEGGQGPLRNEDTRRDLVKHLQKMLNELGYQLWSLRNRGGIDGNFSDKTLKAVKDFQESHNDWEDEPLENDGLVDPRTADALNRALVGLWYDSYETPSDVTRNQRLITMTETYAKETGLEI